MSIVAGIDGDGASTRAATATARDQPPVVFTERCDLPVSRVNRLYHFLHPPSVTATPPSGTLPPILPDVIAVGFVHLTVDKLILHTQADGSHAGGVHGIQGNYD